MLLRLFVIVSLRKIDEDNLNERDDYGVCYSLNNNTHMGLLYLFVSEIALLISLIPPPQILDIYSVVVL